MTEQDELKAAAERCRAAQGGLYSDEDWRSVYPNLSREAAWHALSDDRMKLVDAYLARERVTESQLSLLNDVAGLCHSEANRWERAAPKTAEHWRKAAVELQATYLAAHAALADRLTRERVVAAVGELFSHEDVNADRLLLRAIDRQGVDLGIWWRRQGLIDRLCRLLKVEE